MVFDFFDSHSLKAKVRKLKKAIRQVASHFSEEDLWINQLGAYDIDPKHLSFWVCVKTDKERDRLRFDSVLNTELRRLVYESGYPEEAVDNVEIGFESQETVDRDSEGHWFFHFK